MPVPGVRPSERFTLRLRGSFGRFKTNSSHTLHYLTTTVRAGELGRLATAAETFDLAQSHFEELIQRDVDSRRVREMALGYLKHGQGRAIFFPPLLVCVAVLDENGALKEGYSGVEHKPVVDNGERILRSTFDGDGFKVELYGAPSEQGERTIEFDGKQEPFYDYAALLALNPDRTKLVVLDGQHRLEALRLLLRTTENRAVVTNIEQPICIVWMPNTEAGAKDESIVKDLRSIFVTVNNEPLRVSGHFITLLNDDSYSAMAVRQLADNWKKETVGNWSRLHLLEWNTRDNQSTDQRLRPFSITTISIIDKALRLHLFNTSFGTTLLRLADRAEELQTAAPERDFGGLRDEATRNQQFDDIIKEQIDAHLVPALNVMLRTYRPYAELEQKLGQAFVELRRRREQGNLSADNLNTYLQRFVYRSDDFQDELTKAAWNEFRTTVGPEEDDRVYFLAVYQHGLLRAWVSIGRVMADIAINAVATANAIKAAFEVYVGNPDTRYLAPEASYVRRVLWRAGGVNYSAAWAHESWTNIQLATLLRPDVRRALLDTIPAAIWEANSRAALEAKLAALGNSSALRYTARLEAEIGKEVERNLADYFGGEAEAGSMRDLRTTDRDDFDQRVSKKAREVFIEAIAPLAIHLMRDVDQLDPSG